MNGSTRSTGLVRRWIPSLIWMGVIFFVSAQPTVPSVPGRWDLLLKKTMHVLGYGFLTWLNLRALRGSRADDASTRAVSAGMALLYAASDEYHQTFVPGRNGSLVDVAIDGVGVGSVILLDWRYRTGRHSEGAQASG